MASGLAARHGGRAGLAALVAVLALGLGLRLDYAWKGRAPVYDATAYAAIAANLEQGHGFTVGPTATQPSSNYSPGLPLFVAGLYEVTGGVHERLARLVLAVIGSLSVLLAYLLGRRLWRSMHFAGPGRQDASRAGPELAAGLIAALAVAIYPALLEYQGMMMSEPLAATLLAGAVLAMLWARDEPGALRWLLPGALLGALAMVRPEYLGVAVILALVAALRSSLVPHGDTSNDRKRGWRDALLRAAVMLGAVVVIVAPWTVRNAVALHRFVPISTGGGQVLFAGTYLPSGGNPERVGAEVVARHPELFGPEAVKRLRLEQILARLAAHRYPGMEADQALSKMGKEQLWDDLTEEPLEYAGFLATKIGRLWFHPARDVMRAPVWRALQWAVTLLALLGLALLAWRRRWEALLLGAVLLSITAISALLVASPRRVLVLLPLLAALAGVALAWAASAARPARTPT